MTPIILSGKKYHLEKTEHDDIAYKVYQSGNKGLPMKRYLYGVRKKLTPHLILVKGSGGKIIACFDETTFTECVGYF